MLHPAELPWPAEPVVGAERVHRIFRGWLAELGHEAYAEGDGKELAWTQSVAPSTSS